VHQAKTAHAGKFALDVAGTRIFLEGLARNSHAARSDHRASRSAQAVFIFLHTVVDLGDCPLSQRVEALPFVIGIIGLQLEVQGNGKHDPHCQYQYRQPDCLA